MKIYLVSRKDDWGYDDYSDFVCYAETDEQAKLMHPSGHLWQGDGWHMVYHDGKVAEEPGTYHGWADKLDNIKIKELGESSTQAVPEIILTSFHAG